MRTDVSGVEPRPVWVETPADQQQAFRERLRRLLDGWEGGFDEGSSWYSRDPRARIWDGTAVPGPGYEAYAQQARGFVSGLESLRNTHDLVRSYDPRWQRALVDDPDGNVVALGSPNERPGCPPRASAAPPRVQGGRSVPGDQ